MNIPSIHVHDEIHALGIDVNFIVFKNIQNKRSDDSFNSFRQETLSEIISSLSKESIKTDTVLDGYRDLRTAVGISRSKNICSSEALLNYLLKKQTLPDINLLVNIYNLLSVATHISIGAHDIHAIEGRVNFKITSGDETFLPMGVEEPVKINKGEYAYIDDKEILCRLDYRQCNKTKITESSECCLFIVQGNANTNKETINKVTQDLIQLVEKYCDGEVEKVQY